MSKNLQDLQPDFKNKVISVLKRCANDKITMIPYCTFRTLEEQARLWRQSRTTSEIDKKTKFLRENNCKYLAHIIDKVGPQNGRWATNAIPGLSWHNWGYAVDCYAEIEGIACWDANNNAYNVYAKHARSVGLEAGHLWKHKDSVHIQMNDKSITDMYTLKEVNDYFENMQG